ncbi:MAG: hypothetical protein H6551_12770 [Chitinophagales bacterium]|nr:hypothetical protein [Chitinophagaceae bacterium]MCB9066005.1 hypothetical protein [Chitinophagales bacterium]
MRGFFTLLSVIGMWMTHTVVCAQQSMEGQILDVGDREPIRGVAITNVYTSDRQTSDIEGHFRVEVKAGELVEFRKEGYKILRVRVPNGKLPSYFRVMMQEQGTDVVDYVNARGAAPDYKTDSVRYYMLYKETLEFSRLSGLEAIQHPFSAMSKKNRQIWAFQEEYAYHQQQKFIDYAFNKDLVHKITGFEGDSLATYMHLYRPTYTQLRMMNEYTYYNYIKNTSDAYRDRGIKPKSTHTPRSFH